MKMQTWEALIESEQSKPYFKALMEFVDERYNQTTVYPPKEQIYNAFKSTPLAKCRVVILGQDPYHQPHQAMGLSFSVNKGLPLPKSLANMYKELFDDCGVTRLDGDLSAWAAQGVLLLNTILTVEKGSPLSHQNKGWEVFTDSVIRLLSEQSQPIIFVLWGKQAQSKQSMIEAHHPVIVGPHPSPLSAYRGFFGSKPFSTINNYLAKNGESPIDWS